MQGKIALEEHFAIPETLEDSRGYFPERVWQEVKRRRHGHPGAAHRRDGRHGIEMMLLSLNAPAVQAIPDPAQANEHRAPGQRLSRRTGAQAAGPLPRPGGAAMQDPDGATRELERCVKELGFRGALVNGFSQVGDAETTALLRPAAIPAVLGHGRRLDVPFYLHPRNPLPRDAKIYEGHPWLLGPIWAFGHETAVHALRLMASGLFDAHPRLQIILGHMGENLPFAMWRVDNANAWIENRHSWPAKKRLSDYFRENFYVTTSGNFHTPALLNTMLEIGADRIMFSTDWPFENIDHAAVWFDACPISENDRLKIGRDNARRLFRLGN